MALFNCPECGALISDKAAACPKCGVTINPNPIAINIPVRRTPTISDRTAVGIIATMATVMFSLCLIPWLRILPHDVLLSINLSYWGLAALGLAFAAIGFAFTKQWIASTAAVVTGMCAAAAACFNFKSSFIIDEQAAEISDYKILYAFMAAFMIAGAIAAVVGAIKFAERHIPDRCERKAESSWTQLSGITLCALLAISYYTVWRHTAVTYYEPTAITGHDYILSHVTSTCVWVAMFGICTRRWIATAITAAINLFYGIYTLTTEGFAGTYNSSYHSPETIESTTSAGGIYVMIIVAGLLLVVSIIADRQNAQAAEA